jgi:hypothetical protein
VHTAARPHGREREKRNKHISSPSTAASPAITNYCEDRPLNVSISPDPSFDARAERLQLIASHKRVLWLPLRSPDPSRPTDRRLASLRYRRP